MTDHFLSTKPYEAIMIKKKPWMVTREKKAQGLRTTNLKSMSVFFKMGHTQSLQPIPRRSRNAPLEWGRIVA